MSTHDHGEKLLEPAHKPDGQVLTSEDLASRLLAEAESFLHLGLIEKAIEHLTAALIHNPLLSELRRSLVKLYVVQRQYKSAIAELWALLLPCAQPQEEIRYLRYILRLDSQDQAARQRLLYITSHFHVDLPSTRSDEETAKVSVSSIDGELREALENHRPPTDLAPTLLLPVLQPQRYMELPNPSADTQPNPPESAAVAEELARNSSALKEEMQEVGHCLEQRRYDDARRLIDELAARYPHNKAVQAQLDELDLPDQPESSSTHPSLPEIKVRATSPTFDVDSGDLQVLDSGPIAAPLPSTLSSTLPPPLPRPSRAGMTEASYAALLGFRMGVSLWNRGQFAQAILEFDKAIGDAKQGARAALMIGRCYREQGRTPEAIASFMLGINMPETSDPDLSELFYQLGQCYEVLSDPREAILFYQMSLGHDGVFRDAAERINALQQRLRQL